MDAEIKIKDLNLYAGRQHILKNINVEIPKNKITVIIGPSGCGKTTLLKCLNRLIDLYEDVKVSGSIMIDNEDILHPEADLTKIRQKMGLLSQRPYPLPMNIYDNVAYGMRINGIKKKRILDEQVEYQLKHANLWEEVKDRLRDSTSKLSIGQQQRLCLARGLAVNPEIILADEPTSALDPISSQVIEEKFTELKDEYTIILVTHILRQARRIGDYIMFMYLGELIEHGPAEEIFNNPKMEKTKSYLKGVFN
jgi:phosphate transport system ATP-binding protein